MKAMIKKGLSSEDCKDEFSIVPAMWERGGEIINVFPMGMGKPEWFIESRENGKEYFWHTSWLDFTEKCETSVSRKHYPVATGVLAYFPLSMKALAHCSYVGNEQHNKGEPLHWDRSKSTDEDDAMIRHYLDSLGPNKVDSDGVLHSTKVCWRALARLEKLLEAGESK